ncbi:MAG: HlyD family efflux transporter periplasmic adaptor subunit [Phycisphaerales bacterium]
MIDLTTLKAPGWAKIVAELNAPAPDDRTYLDRLLRVLVRASTARQGVLLLPPAGGENSEPRVLSIFPTPGASPGDPDGRAAEGAAAEGMLIEHGADVRAAALAAMETGQARAFGLDQGTPLYDADPSRGYVLALCLPDVAGRPVAAATLLLEPRSKQAVQSTLAIAELLVGYVHGHASRQQLRRNSANTFALELGTRLLAAVNSTEGFRGACIQLVNDAAKQLGADRVALGWCVRDSVQVKAISDTEHFDRRVQMVRKLEAAMDECLDQEQPVLHPAPPAETDALLSQAVTSSHRELAAGNADLRLCSVPLRDKDSVVGVLTVEATGAGVIDLNTIEVLQATLDLVAPVMRVRHDDDRNLALRAWHSAKRGGAWAVGTKHTVWKLAGIALLAAFLFCTFWTTTYTVGAPATIQPRTRQIVSVPFDALLKSFPESVEAGSVVKAGDVVAQLDTAEIELAAQDALQKIAQAEKMQSTARAQGRVDEAQRAEAQALRARAELDLARSRIERSRLTAPIDGTIIAGRLASLVGSSLKLGDRLFEVAPLNELVIIARVDERDIAMIAEGGKGLLATRSHPDETHEVVIERVVPLAEAAEGKNRFEVRARVVTPASWMRPGMEGVAKLDTQRRSLLWIGTRRVLDAIRLWWW